LPASDKHEDKSSKDFPALARALVEIGNLTSRLRFGNIVVEGKERFCGIADDDDRRPSRTSQSLDRSTASLSITIQLDLPDALINEARAVGLLESARFVDWLTEELRRKRAREEFGQTLRKLHSVADEPMSLEEIQTEVNAVRGGRRRREGGR
jgi:hypothetical protein